MIAAVTVALAIAFHLIPTPPDIDGVAEFALQGYTGEAQIVTPMPQFHPETSEERPTVDISFIAPFDGQCLAAQTETLDGHTQFTVAAKAIDVKAHTRAFMHGVLAGLDDLTGDPWLPLVEQRYRIAVACVSDDGTQKVFSSFYEVPTPPPTWRSPT